MVSHAIAPAYALAVRDVRYHSVAALTFLVWQFFLTLDEEVHYIWPMRNKNPFKWVYFYFRYGVVLAHVIHNSLMEQLANGTNPPILCDMWCAYIIAFTQTLATSLELILASRVFALYNRSRRVALFLLILILVEVGTAVRILWLRDAVVESYGTCLLILASSGRDQSILGFSVHCTLIGLTMFKYIVASKAGWGRTPLVSLVIRDGSIVYATIFFILVSVLLLFGLRDERGVAIFFWATGLMSVSGCYLVINMERFAKSEIPVDSAPELVITTELGMRISGSGILSSRS